MDGIRVGRIALASAAIVDIVAWSMLALATAVARGGSAGTEWHVLLIVPFAVLLRVLRPFAGRRLSGRADPENAPGTVVAAVVAGVLVCGAATAWMGCTSSSERSCSG